MPSTKTSPTRRQQRRIAPVESDVPLARPARSSRCQLQRPNPISSAHDAESTSHAQTDIPAEAEAFSNLSLNDNRFDKDRCGLKTTSMYCAALRSSGHYFVIGQNEAAALANWNDEKCELSFLDYPIITPIGFVAENGDRIVLLDCSCAESLKQHHRLRTLDNSLPLTDAKFVEEQKLYCLHRTIVNQLGLGLLPVDNDAAEVEIEQHMVEPALLWSVKVRESYGVVKRSANGNLSCVTCRKRNCSHVATFVKDHKDFEIELPPVMPPPDRSTVVSRLKISLKDDLLAAFRYPLEHDSIASSLSRSTACQHGYLWKGNKRERNCTIWNELGRAYDGGVVYEKESRCSFGCKSTFDGSDFGVINVNNDNMVEYSLLSLYMAFFERDGMPLVAFHEALVKQNMRRACETIPYNVLYRAWTGFSALIQFDEQDDFACAICGKHPEVIVLDGTALGCRKDLLPKSDDLHLTDLPALSGISHDQRVFVTENKTRKLLRRFAVGGTNKEKEMSADEMRTMVERIGKEYGGTALLELVRRLTENGQCSAPDEYRLLLRELAKPTSLCGLFQAGAALEDGLRALRGVIGGFLDIASSDEQESVDILRACYPGILECLLPIRKRNNELPPDVRRLLGMMVRKLEQQFAVQNDGRSNADYLLPDTNDDSLGFFPNWPVVRGYGNYSAAVERGSKDEADACTKYRHGSKVLGAGIVLYLCPHSVCYGYSIMDSYESPRMPFETFTMRNYAPSNVVYDNACKLHVYCLKREPDLFAQTRFFVDRFHWVNHTACAIGYDMNRYKSDPILTSVNSQVNEQLNSRLLHLRRSLSYMSLGKFMLSLKIFLGLRNRCLISNL